MQRSKQKDSEMLSLRAVFAREGMVGENPRKKLLKLLLSFYKTLQALYCMAKAR